MLLFFKALLKHGGKIVAILWGVATIVYAVVKEFSEAFLTLTAKFFAEVTTYAAPGELAFDVQTILPYVDIINAFIPLAEAWVLLLSLFGIWLIVITFRWVKSFIPTVSN